MPPMKAETGMPRSQSPCSSPVKKRSEPDYEACCGFKKRGERAVGGRNFKEFPCTARGFSKMLFNCYIGGKFLPVYLGRFGLPRFRLSFSLLFYSSAGGQTRPGGTGLGPFGL